MDPMLFAGGAFQILIFLWLGFQGGWFAVLLFGVCAKPSRPRQKRCCCQWWRTSLVQQFYKPEVENPKQCPCPVTYLYTYICSSIYIYICICINRYTYSPQQERTAYLLGPLESLFESLEWTGHAESQGYFYSCLGLLLDRCGYISNHTPSELSQSVCYLFFF